MAENTADTMLRILSLEDDVHDFDLMRARLVDAGLSVHLRRVETETAFLEALHAGTQDIILSDFHLPAFDASTALKLARDICPHVPFICVSGTIGEEAAIELIQDGADDYVIKDNLTRLPNAIQRAIERAEVIRSRQRTEAALQASERRYKAIIETSMDGFWQLGTDGRLLQVNQAYVRMSGYSECELLGMQVHDLEAVESGVCTDEHLRQIVQSGEHRFESCHRRKDGSIFPLEITVQFKDEEGGYLVAFLRDISQRKETMQALRESEMQLRLVTDHAPVLLAKCGSDLRYTFVNQRYSALFDKRPEDIIGRHPRSVLGHEAYEVAFPYITAVLAGAEVEYDLSLPETPKGARTLHVHYVPEFGAGGEVTGFLAAAADITERKRVEDALVQSEARFRTMFEKHTAVMLLIDPDSGAILDANSAAAAFYGYGIPALLRMNIEDINTLAPAAVALERQRAMREERNYFVFPHRLADQSVRIVEVHSAPVTLNERSVLFSIIHDITRRTQAENELITAKLRAERSERLKDVFIANISHEIRTPLNIILGYTGVIADKFLPGAPENTKRFFESVERGGERLMRTVDMILNVSRLQAGEFTLKPVQIDIPKLVMKIAADHQALAQQKGLLLSAEDECGSALVYADEYCIAQAVSNLVHNAIKFTSQGGVDLRVFYDASGRVCLSCRDTGIGISPDYLPSLFSRYSQEQSGYTRPFEGLGLGMALVKEYLALNGASIDVQSVKGDGSTFTITFETPVLDAQGGVGNRAEAQQEEGMRPTGVRARPSVLLIEDDEMTLEYMDVVLAERYEIHAARSGPEAWDVLRVTPIDIVLMDISLAGKQTGIELTQEIRRSPEHRSLPIIAVTAHAYERDRDNCLIAGCDDFIRKPISGSLLLERMEQLLRR